MKIKDKIIAGIIFILLLVLFGYAYSEMTDLQIHGWMNVTGEANFTGNVTMIGPSHGTYVNFTCYNPGCTHRVYSNGTSLIVENI